jgi:hypothetical protein
MQESGKVRISKISKDQNRRDKYFFLCMHVFASNISLKGILNVPPYSNPLANKSFTPLQPPSVHPYVCTGSGALQAQRA